jgi:hypothetical protein
MGDDNDTPAAIAAAPESAKGWSEQDRRNLIITIAGGLAANLGTVILIGLAIAFVHLTKHENKSRFPYNWDLPLTLSFCVLGLVMIAASNLIRSHGRYDRFDRGILLLLGSLMILEALLIWTGLAAGVK